MADVLVAHPEDEAPGLLDVAEQGSGAGRDGAARGQLDRRLKRLGRDVVVRIAVGQAEGAQPLGVTGGEDLRDRSAGVVGDEQDAAAASRSARDAVDEILTRLLGPAAA